MQALTWCVRALPAGPKGSHFGTQAPTFRLQSVKVKYIYKFWLFWFGLSLTMQNGHIFAWIWSPLLSKLHFPHKNCYGPGVLGCSDKTWVGMGKKSATVIIKLCRYRSISASRILSFHLYVHYLTNSGGSRAGALIAYITMTFPLLTHRHPPDNKTKNVDQAALARVTFVSE